MLSYEIQFEPDDNGTVLVTALDFPELTTFGEDADDAALRALDALEEAIAARISARKVIPAPSTAKGDATVELPTQTALKVMLFQAMTEQGVRKADLARRLSWHAPQVDRLLNLRHASRTDQFDAAFRVLGKALSVKVETHAA